MSDTQWEIPSRYLEQREKISELEVEIELLAAELQERREQVDDYQQKLDEVVVTLGSLGLTHSEIVDAVKRLTAENERLREDNRALTKQVGRLAGVRGRLQAGKDPDMQDA